MEIFIQEYDGFEQKRNRFKLTVIDSISQFYDVYQNLLNAKGIFRGLCESRYKLYSSYQRNYISKNGNVRKLNDYIKVLFENQRLLEYFEGMKIETRLDPLLVLLQHYELPTTLIDFTLNVNIALAFALQNIKSEETKGDISDYFSIYFIEEKYCELLDIKHQFDDYRKPDESMFKRAESEGSTRLKIIELLEMTLDINRLDIYYINPFDVKKYNLLNNINIIFQRGVFINNKSPNVALEDHLRDFFIDETEYHPSYLDDASDPNSPAIVEYNHELANRNKILQNEYQENIIHSFEIRKDLIPYIKELIAFDTRDLYPDLKYMLKKAFS